MGKIEDEILSWRYEERQYVNKAIENYHKNRNIIAQIFTTEKQERKNIEYITRQAELKYRAEKLDKMLTCIEQDRRRVDEQVEFANKELQKILSEIAGSLPQVKFEIGVLDCKGTFQEISEAPMEIKTIKLKPYTINFIQQKLI